MTDGRGRRARWTAALLITPGAAAMFGASTSWVVHAHPSVTTTPKAISPAVAANAPTPSQEVLAFREALAANKAQLAAMQDTVVGLQNQLKGLGSAGTAGGATGGVGTGTSTSSSGSGTRTVPTAPASPAAAPAAARPAAPAPPAAPAAAAPAPPPVQAVTGASGAPK